jgi:hypothetical protein
MIQYLKNKANIIFRKFFYFVYIDKLWVNKVNEQSYLQNYCNF